LESEGSWPIARVMMEEKSIAVLHVCSISPTMGQSGYEIRVIEETHLLKEKGIKVIILCFIRRNQLFSLSRLFKLYHQLRKMSGAIVYIVPTSNFFDLQISPCGDKWISRAIIFISKFHRVKIIHGQALYSTMHILRIRQKLNAKVVFEVHGASPEETEMSGGHPNRIKKLEEWEKEAFRSADHFNFVSYKMRDYFQKKYSLNFINYSIIPCCVHTEKFVMVWNEREQKRHELGLNDKIVIAYLGTLTVWQWPEAMFTLFEQIHKKRKDTFFYLLVPGSDHDKALELIHKHNISDDSYRLEEVPHDKVGAFLGIADIGLLLRKQHPVNYVASPTKFGEYLAAGVPVIVTDEIGDTSAIIDKNKVGIVINVDNEGVSEENLNRLIDFIDKLKIDRNEFAHRCKQTAESELDWNVWGQKLIDAYHNILS